MIFPAPLQPGDKIGIVAPSGAIRYPDDILNGYQLLTSQGWAVVEGISPSLRHFQYAGTDEERLMDLQFMLDHPGIRAIIAVRGGYGCSRIIDRLDFTGFKRHPKWLVGFSDITLLLSHLEKLGYAAIHGPMVKHLGANPAATEFLFDLLKGRPVAYTVNPHPQNRPGKVTGGLIGGNLCLLAHGIGSASEIDTRGRILFLEDVGEPLYNLDRMMWQLRRAGKLHHLAGLVAGRFTNCKGTPESFGSDAVQIIADHVSAFSYPVAFEFPFGHVDDNRPLVVGAAARLSVSPEQVSITIPQPEHEARAITAEAERVG